MICLRLFGSRNLWHSIPKKILAFLQCWIIWSEENGVLTNFPKLKIKDFLKCTISQILTKAIASRGILFTVRLFLKVDKSFREGSYRPWRGWKFQRPQNSCGKIERFWTQKWNAITLKHLTLHDFEPLYLLHLPRL